MANYAEAASFDINANNKDPYPRYMANFAGAASFVTTLTTRTPTPGTWPSSQGELKKKVLVGFDYC
jgi:hypothetical protein